MQGPEIQQMYSLNMPVSAIRTKIRQEFERHRFVAQIKTVDVLLFNSHSEFQVRRQAEQTGWSCSDTHSADDDSRKPSTTGSSSHTYSSTLGQRRTPKPVYRRTSFRVSSRYIYAPLSKAPERLR